jgi:hypothetical protein
MTEPRRQTSIAYCMQYLPCSFPLCISDGAHLLDVVVVAVLHLHLPWCIPVANWKIQLHIAFSSAR